MDGDRALIFARSRHSISGNEGSDFARSKRQQKIIFALKEKLFSSTLFFRPQKIAGIISSLRENISTNLETWQILTLGATLKKVNADSVITTVFDDSEQGYLVSATTPDGAYVLQPKDGSFLAMQEKVLTIFDEMPAETDHNIGNRVRVAIKNGTHIDGLASNAASLLKDYAYTINAVGNAQIRDYQKTAIYDLTRGKQQRALDFLKATFDAEAVYDPYSTELLDHQDSDFVIILGNKIPDTLQRRFSLRTTLPEETTAPSQ
jgi:hypothetical protein